MTTESRTSGYTIIEIMIVLAVSSALLVAGLLLVGGQQARTEFNQSANSLKSTIDQVINNVQDGYYSRPSNFSCSAPPSGGPVLDSNVANARDRGSNQDCIFVGRAIQFAVGGNPRAYNIYDLAGRRLNGGGQPVTSINETLPTALSVGSTTNAGFTADTTESHQIDYNFDVRDMSYRAVSNASPVTKTGIVAFVTDFPSGAANESSSRVAELYEINGTTTAVNLATPPPAFSKGDGVDTINYHGKPFGPYKAFNFQKVYSVSICLENPTKLYAIITIGGNNSQLSTSLRFVDVSSKPAECV